MESPYIPWTCWSLGQYGKSLQSLQILSEHIPDSEAKEAEDADIPRSKQG
jgi:hypothetical protein